MVTDALACTVNEKSIPHAGYQDHDDNNPSECKDRSVITTAVHVAVKVVVELLFDAMVCT